MKILLINGSPREKGCTYTALKIMDDIFINNGIETKILNIGKEETSGFSFSSNINDKLIVETAKTIKDYDGFVFGSPVYYASPNGTLISFLDRLFAACKDFSHKPACCIVSCRRGGASSALDVLNKYPLISSMPLIASNYWNMVHGNTPEEVMKDLEGVQTMEVLANNMVWLLKCIENGKSSGILPPILPSKIKTNFI